MYIQIKKNTNFNKYINYSKKFQIVAGITISLSLLTLTPKSDNFLSLSSKTLPLLTILISLFSICGYSSLIKYINRHNDISGSIAVKITPNLLIRNGYIFILKYTYLFKYCQYNFLFSFVFFSLRILCKIHKDYQLL